MDPAKNLKSRHRCKNSIELLLQLRRKASLHDAKPRLHACLESLHNAEIRLHTTIHTYTELLHHLPLSLAPKSHHNQLTFDYIRKSILFKLMGSWRFLYFNEPLGPISKPSTSFRTPPSLPFPSFSRQTQVNLKETSRAHVFRAMFLGFDREDVLDYIDDDNMLQISTDDGKFMSKFKLPDNARRDQLKDDMVNGVLIVTIPTEEVASHRPNVRVVEIESSG